MIGRLSALLALGLSLDACASRAPVEIRIRQVGEDMPCKAEVDGELFDAQSLGARARRGRWRSVTLHGDADMPYRCVGGSVFELQRAGVRRMGVVAEPATEENR
jgi:hypothetical protein